MATGSSGTGGHGWPEPAGTDRRGPGEAASPGLVGVGWAPPPGAGRLPGWRGVTWARRPVSTWSSSESKAGGLVKSCRARLALSTACVWPRASTICWNCHSSCSKACRNRAKPWGALLAATHRDPPPGQEDRREAIHVGRPVATQRINCPAVPSGPGDGGSLQDPQLNWPGGSCALPHVGLEAVLGRAGAPLLSSPGKLQPGPALAQRSGFPWHSTSSLTGPARW